MFLCTIDYEDLSFDFCGGFVGYLGWVLLEHVCGLRILGLLSVFTCSNFCSSL